MLKKLFSKLKISLKSYKFLSPLIFILGILYYTIIGWLFANRYYISLLSERFNLGNDYLVAFFYFFCLTITLYVLSNIIESNSDKEEKEWFASFVLFFVLMFPYLLFSNNIITENIFMILFNLALFLIFCAIIIGDGNIKFNIEDIITFFSILLSYIYITSYYFSYTKTFFEGINEKINNYIELAIDIRFLIILLIAFLVFIQAVWKLSYLEPEDFNIPKIKYIEYRPFLEPNALIGFVEGIYKAGVKIINNIVFIINYIWIAIAYSLILLLHLILNMMGIVESFINNHVKFAILTSILLFSLCYFLEFTIAFSQTQLEYILNNNNTLIESIKYFILIIISSIVIKISYYFSINEITINNISTLLQKIFKSTISATLIILTNYTISGWILYILDKYFDTTYMINHFNNLLYATISVFIVLIVSIRLSVIFSKKIDKFSEEDKLENKYKL